MLARYTLPRGRAAAYISFVLIYISYVVFYFNRKNYSFWFNELVTTVGMPLEQASIFGSAMEFSYGIGKLIAGPIVDSYPSPSLILAGTLAVSSICNLFLFTTDFLSLNVLLWCVNGIIQAAAWPALAIIFINWFRDAPNKGTMYSILSTSQNMGSGLIPIVLSPIVAHFGWRAATIAPGVIGLGVSALLILFLEEGPTGKEKMRKDVNKTPKVEGNQESGFAAFKKGFLELFSSWDIRFLAAGYALLTIVRVGISDWSLVVLQDLRGLSVESAKDCLVALELGGFIGGMATGSISDFVFKGQRSPVMFWFCILMFPCLVIIMWVPLEASLARLSLSITYGVFGFFSFGPHMLVGLLAREIYPSAPSTAGSYSKFVGQIGGTLAGYPLSKIATSSYGWNAVAVTWALCTLLAALMFGQVAKPRIKSE